MKKRSKQSQKPCSQVSPLPELTKNQKGSDKPLNRHAKSTSVHLPKSSYDVEHLVGIGPTMDTS